MNKKCQVTYYKCGNKAVASIVDVVCSGEREPFYVCRKHKLSFLKGKHYELVENLKEKK